MGSDISVLEGRTTSAGNPRQPRRNRIGQRIAVERRHFGRAQIGERQHHQRVLRCAVARRLAKPLGKHREKARGALLGFRARGRQVGGGIAGNDAGLDLQRLHDRLQRLAHFGRGVVARAGILFKARRNHALQLRRNLRHNLAQIRRIGELNRANGLKVFGIGPRKRMPPAGQFVQDHAQRPHVRLHARVAGDKLLRRHVADRAAARRIGGGHRRILGQRRLAWIEACVFGRQPTRQAEVENLYQSAIGQHHVLRLQVAMKDAQRMRSLQSVGDLDAD